MIETIFLLAGGLGLFLSGMLALTDGLKAFAGDSLRRAMVRFTGTPAKAFLSGALATALVQSSSATTVTVIGFVSAGLLDFPQAIGVVIGASLGTTGTGWIVAGLGLKISIGFYALPIVAIGAALRLVGGGRWKDLGIAASGFGIIFIGIDFMQDAMRSLTTHVDFAVLPSEGHSARMASAAVGFVLTLLMQSSSAAVATALTALHAGVLQFEQAAGLTVGAAIGTTVTGALAAIGGTAAAKRTALAHVAFNLFSGLLALALLPVFLRGIAWAQAAWGLESGAMSLAAFHTAFISLGCALALPFARPFARLIERALPDHSSPMIRHLDDTVLQAPPVALEAALRASRETASDCFDALRAMLADSSEPDPRRVARLRDALGHIERFLARIPPMPDDDRAQKIRVNLLHALDHLARLHKRLRPPAAVRERLARDPLFCEAIERVRALLSDAARGVTGQEGDGVLRHIEAAASEISQARQRLRALVLEQSALTGALDEGMSRLDAIRWLDRIAYHVSRAVLHLVAADDQEPSSTRLD